ncbi:hypothetical protein [Gayadomonas joobiniege]|uniref:hypothetical protein n=1 Tax=Gayadomonas joobiniege TaxID=1234606 RepID=UPI000368C0F6|nr:hypothetical protein [Gayadomonas joobiniege]
MACENTNGALLAQVYEKEQSNRTGVGDFKEINFFNDEDKSGLFISVYQDINTQEVIFAIRGTNDLMGDLSADSDFVTGGFHDQFEKALDFAKGEMDTHGWDASNVSVVGHSLGGGHAQILSHTFGFSGTTYDPAAASQVIGSSEYQSWLNNNNVTAVGSPSTFNNYVESGSIVGQGTDVLGDHIGGNTYLVDLRSNEGNYFAAAVA